MSIFRNDTLGSWTRGGQAIVHNVRMTTQVFFVASQVKDALTVPVAALQSVPGSTAQIARVVAKNGAIEDREVRLGISDRLRVEVLEGLSEGDHLLIGPVDSHGG